AVGDAGELLPAHERTLAASLERLEPAPSHLVEVPPQTRAVTGNGIVVQVPFKHLSQPRPGLGNGVVHSLAALHLDRLQLSQHPLLDRLAPDDERAPFAGSRAEMREAEEVERRGLPLSKLRTV